MEHEISPGLRAAFVGAGIASVYAAVVLTLFPENTADLFAWDIKPPMTALFVGAFFAVGIPNQFLLARKGTTWRTARVAVGALFTLSVTMLVATVLHWDRFLWDRPITWSWLALYGSYALIVPFLAVAHQRAAGPEGPPKVAVHPLIPVGAVIAGAVLGGLGLALMISPSQVGQIWAWPLTPLTGRVVGGWLVFLAAALAGVARERDWTAIRPNAPFLSVAGVLLLIGLVRYPLDWSLVSAWVFAAAAVAITVVPVGLFFAYERVLANA